MIISFEGSLEVDILDKWVFKMLRIWKKLPICFPERLQNLLSCQQYMRPYLTTSLQEPGIIAHFNLSTWEKNSADSFLICILLMILQLEISYIIFVCHWSFDFSSVNFPVHVLCVLFFIVDCNVFVYIRDIKGINLMQ